MILPYRRFHNNIPIPSNIFKDTLLEEPRDVCVDDNDIMYVTDSCADSVYIFGANKTGVRELLLKFGGTGSLYGQFDGIGGISADPGNNRVRV